MTDLPTLTDQSIPTDRPGPTTGPPSRPTEDWTDRILELEIGPVAHGGHCVARSDGRVVFVRHALPGERVRAVVSEDGGGSFCRADVVTVLEPAAQRVPAPCSWARAGGCLLYTSPSPRDRS